MTSSKPLGSLSLDLDNQWSYLKTHGDPGWESFPSYLDKVVPRILQFFKDRNVTISFFVVGQDAVLDKNKEALSALAAAGHEIGNHSFHHDSWTRPYSAGELEVELARAEEAIERATGRKPVGFRAPGFSLSRETLEALARRRYRYDASTLPTFLGPLARAYYFLTARMSPQERKKRRALFGRFGDGLRPIRPYGWRLDDGELLEIPVTTMPFLRLPMHVSYLLYLNGFNGPLALRYFRTALGLCRLAGVEASLLLHPLDFMGCDDLGELAFFPGMGLPARQKLELVSDVLEHFGRHFEIVTLERHASAILGRPTLRKVEPRFNQSRQVFGIPAGE